MMQLEGKPDTEDSETSETYAVTALRIEDELTYE